MTNATEPTPKGERETTQERVEAFLKSYFGRTPEEIAADYYDLRAAEALLRDEDTPEAERGQAQEIYDEVIVRERPTREVSEALKQPEYEARLWKAAEELEAQAAETLNTNEQAVKLALVQRSLFDLRFNLGAGLALEDAAVPKRVRKGAFGSAIYLVDDSMGYVFGGGRSHQMQEIIDATYTGSQQEPRATKE